MSRERHTPEQKAEVAGLRASGLTHEAIAQRTGIPRRSVTAILASTPISTVVEAATLEQVSSRLWAVVSAGTEEALRRIHDPATKAGELAQLLKVAADQYALLNGQATSRTENLNVNIEEERPLTTAEQRAQLVGWLELIERSTDDELTEFEHRANMILRIGAGTLGLSAQPRPGTLIQGGPDALTRHAGALETDRLRLEAEK